MQPGPPVESSLCRKQGHKFAGSSLVICLICVRVLLADSWVKLGPEGGPVRQFAQNPARPAILYVGTDSGIFKSTDGGVQWKSTNWGLQARRIAALSVVSSDPARLFAAGFGAAIASSEELASLFRTNDDGDSWAVLRLPVSDSAPVRAVGEILTDPHDADSVYVAVGASVFRSTDAGEHWTSASVGTDGLNCSVSCLGASAATASSVLFAGTNCGVFKSIDSGQSWRLSSSGMIEASSPPSVFQLLIHPRNSCLIWARSSSNRLWRSTDCGETWSELPKIESQMGFLSLTAHLQDTAVLYGVTPDAVYQTTNSGQSWNLLATLPGLAPTGIWADQVNPDVLWLGTSANGLFRSTDGGSTWHPRNSGLTAISISGVAIDPRDSNVVYAGTRFKSVDGGSSWIELCTTGARLCYWAGATQPFSPVRMVIDPQYPDTLYLPIREGVIKSGNGGGYWTVVGTGLPKNRTPWLLGDPVRSGVLYASAGRLFKSTDGALSFQPITSFDPLFDISYDAAIDWHDPNLLYAVALEGIWTSTDGGQTWRLTGPGLRTGYGRLLADPSRAGTIYSISGGLWRSVDAGITWRQILSDPGIQALAIDRSSSRRLFAYSTSNGFIRSTNGGAQWLPVNTGLPRFGDGYIPVHGIAIGPTDPSVIYVATDQGVFKLHEQASRQRRRR